MTKYQHTLNYGQLNHLYVIKCKAALLIKEKETYGMHHSGLHAKKLPQVLYFTPLDIGRPVVECYWYFAIFWHSLIDKKGLKNDFLVLHHYSNKLLISTLSLCKLSSL